MNRGVLQSLAVQQMMAAANPTWWSLNNMRPPSQYQQPSPFFPPPPLPPPRTNLFPHFNIPTSSSPSSSSSSSPSLPLMEQEQLPESWSQLLMGGLVGEEEKATAEGGFNDFLSNNSSKKMESDNDSWDDHLALVMHHHPSVAADHVKQENSSSPSSYAYHHQDHRFQAKPIWSTHHYPQMIPVSSSPHESCATTFSSNNMLDFPDITTKSDASHSLPIRSNTSSQSNCTATGGGALKKAKVKPSSTQSPFKVRKEKLGDRITALHQLVSPFGKTDTASVLLEAIDYIRFLQSQIEALSLPYLSSASGNKRQSHSGEGGRNYIFPEDPAVQLLNDNCLKRKGGPDQEYDQETPKDLKSRGICLVPVSWTLNVGNDNGADYWAPAFCGGSTGGFR